MPSSVTSSPKASHRGKKITTKIAYCFHQGRRTLLPWGRAPQCTQQSCRKKCQLAIEEKQRQRADEASIRIRPFIVEAVELSPLRPGAQQYNKQMRYVGHKRVYERPQVKSQAGSRQGNAFHGVLQSIPVFLYRAEKPWCRRRGASCFGVRWRGLSPASAISNLMERILEEILLLN